MVFTICPSLALQQPPPSHQSSAQGSSLSQVLMNYTAPLPIFWSLEVLNTLVVWFPYVSSFSPCPSSVLPLVYPFLSPCNALSCPPPALPPSPTPPPQGSAGLASIQSPTISSTSDIIRTEKSWEHSFLMILKWHQGHSGLTGWLLGQLAGWITGWLAGHKKGPKEHYLAGLATGFPFIVITCLWLQHWTNLKCHVSEIIAEIFLL